jgi:hypothetical protein
VCLPFEEATERPEYIKEKEIEREREREIERESEREIER